MKKNKIILCILALVLIIGIVMVCVKGFNVSLDLRAHDTLKFVFDEKFKMSDVTKICDEVFKDKEYEVKTVEVFSDAVYIISPSITESEEKALLEKLNDLYVDTSKKDEANTTDNTTTTTAEVTTNAGTEAVEAEDTNTAQEENIFDRLEKGTKYELYHDSKVRIRDLVKPYVVPSIISALIIVVYMAIRYRKLNDGKIYVTVCKTLGEMLVVLLEILAIIAIFRIPFNKALIPIVMFIIVICLCFRLVSFEKKLKEI